MDARLPQGVTAAGSAAVRDVGHRPGRLERDLSRSLPDSALREILDAFYAAQVLVIPGQHDLDAAGFVRFAGLFGRPQPHVARHLRHPEHPEILFLSNVFRNGEPTGIYDGAAYWHTDMSYEEEPGGVTVVHALQVPETGGETLFADQYAAWEALPGPMKRRIDGLTVLHHYGNRDDRAEGSRTAATPLKEDERKAIRNVFHPLVLTHPVTGRRALYAVAGSSFGIVGMPDDEALDLLGELKAHATKPDFVFSHRYAAGDLVAWDNLSTLHSATLIPKATGPADTRLLHRISVKGRPPLLA